MERGVWFFRSIIEQISDAIIITDLQENIIYVNQAMEILMGYKEKELLGKSPSMFNAEEDAMDIQADISNAVRQGEDYIAEIKNRRKDGSIFINKMTIRPFVGKENETTGYIGIHRDVTKEKALSEELATNKQKYYTIFESNPKLIIMADRKGIILDCNSRCEDFLGYKKEEVIGYPIYKFVHPHFHAKIRRILPVLFDKKKSEKTKAEYKLVKSDGELIDVSVESSLINDTAKGIDYIIFVSTDITERKRTELILRDSAEAMKRSNEALEQFAYVASHDLQEPLRVVSSYCQLIRGHCEVCPYKGKCHHQDEFNRHLTYVIEATIRMKNLIKELLDFSRVGRKDNPFEYVDMQTMVEEVISDFTLWIRELNANIVIEDKMPVVFGIKFRLKQLINNLINNSLKFHQNDRIPEVRIGCQKDGNFWLFYVKDNGIGIESKYFDRIFLLFKRLYSREQYPGTGIGLALCQKIVETHGGKIWVDSTPGEGSCFYFTLAKHVDVK